MTFLDKLERRIGWIAVPGLIRIVVTFTGLVYVLMHLAPGFDQYLSLDIGRIAQGEVWRLFTYIFVPRVQHFLLIAIALYFLWFIGNGLEQAWGPFRLTLYFLLGMIGTTAAALLTDPRYSNQMLFATLFFAFAFFYPDEVIYLFFILPVKIKWLAWVYGGLLMLGFVAGTMSYRLGLLVALSNFFIFFGPQMYHQARQRQDISSRRKRFDVQNRAAEEPLHKCATCGATELTDPNLEFRVSRDGEEYCMQHLPGAAATAR
jgi:membrane associated rhomboid family serine protease